MLLPLHLGIIIVPCPLVFFILKAFDDDNVAEKEPVWMKL
jgi:hypothetical protein